jgi:hypothetical protein
LIKRPSRRIGFDASRLIRIGAVRMIPAGFHRK